MANFGELKKANDNEEGNSTVSLKEQRMKAAESQIKEIKPRLDEPVNAVIKDVDIRLDMDKYEHNQGDAEAIYHPGSVIVTTEFEHPDTGETVTSKDWFGGFRAYIALDETKAPLKINGVEQIQRYFPGTNKSGLRRFVNVILDDMTDKQIEKYNDWLDFFLDYMPGLKVKIQSEINTFEGKQIVKQCIVKVRDND